MRGSTGGFKRVPNTLRLLRSNVYRRTWSQVTLVSLLLVLLIVIIIVILFTMYYYCYYCHHFSYYLVTSTESFRIARVVLLQRSLSVLSVPKTTGLSTNLGLLGRSFDLVSLPIIHNNRYHKLHSACYQRDVLSQEILQVRFSA